MSAMPTYVILTSKPGQFHTEPGPGLAPVEAWDYLFYGRKRAQFVLAELTAATRVRVVDEADEPIVNLVPSKFLERFESLDAARAALRDLCRFGDMDIALERVALPAAPAGSAA
jgi:hypothetical protein